MNADDRCRGEPSPTTRVPGDIDVAPANDAVARAHLTGLAALAVVQNYGTNDFDGPRAQAVLDDPRASRRLLQGLADEVQRAGWDGVVLDLEKLVPAARASPTRTSSPR